MKILSSFLSFRNISIRRLKARTAQVVIALSVLSLPLFFQNCGHAFTSDAYDSSGVGEISKFSETFAPPDKLPSNALVKLIPGKKANLTISRSQLCVGNPFGGCIQKF